MLGLPSNKLKINLHVGGSMRDYMNPDFAVGMTKKKKEVKGEIRDSGLLKSKSGKHLMAQRFGLEM